MAQTSNKGAEMIALGIRCSNKDLTYAVSSGTRNKPNIQTVETLTVPKGFKEPESIDWVYREATGIIAKHGIDIIVIKKFEGKSRGQAFSDRVSLEAAVMLSAWHSGQIPIFKKVKSTIAKDLGFKGRARYLSTQLDTSVVQGYDDFDAKSKDAILAAWSEIK
jgi:hypothetical protein